jgi:acetate kinase
VAVLSPPGDVLVVNAGSTSLKLSLVGPDERARPVESLASAPAVGAVGHRVVHGGPRFDDPVVIDDAVAAELESLVELAPLHNAPAVQAISEARERLPAATHVAVFDTAFHRTIPEVARTYALPARFRERGIHRYGFHGLSVAWCAERLPVARLVVCHLGGGSSVTAVRDGRSIDTTMGFTPLEGVPMGSRAGSVDPGALLYLLRNGVSLVELDRALEHESGLVGLAGTDDVALLERDRSPEARLALDVFAYRVSQAVAAMAVSLGGVDCVAFTGGIGEHASGVRGDVCRRLSFVGVELDEQANRNATADERISPEGAAVAVQVVHAREDVMVARAVRSRLAESLSTGKPSTGRGKVGER